MDKKYEAISITEMGIAFFIPLTERETY